MRVRPATQEDAETISELNEDVQRLHAEALPHLFKGPSRASFPPDEIRFLLDDPSNFFFLALEGDEPVGYIYAQIRSLPETGSRFASDYIYIHHISVRPEEQKKGHGERLLQAVKDLAMRNGITRILLDVWEFNTGAQSFFQKQGFEVFNRRMWLEI